MCACVCLTMAVETAPSVPAPQLVAGTCPVMCVWPWVSRCLERRCFCRKSLNRKGHGGRGEERTMALRSDQQRPGREGHDLGPVLWGNRGIVKTIRPTPSMPFSNLNAIFVSDFPFRFSETG